MEPERTESPYMPATSPEWADYYQRAKQTRRLGKNQHAAIKRASKRRVRQANLMLIVSTALLVAVVAAFCAILGTEHAPSSTGEGSRRLTPPSLSADGRRG